MGRSVNRERDSSAPEPDSWKILAGLRFFLAAIVVCGHLSRFVPDEGLFNKGLVLFGMLDPVVAVFGFLVISGYSIAHSIAESPVGYYRRRALRIYPLYFLGVVSALIPYWLCGPRIATLSDDLLMPTYTTILGNLIFLEGFLVPPIDSNRPLWTLSVEVFCYVLAPLFARASRSLLIGLISISLLAYGVFPKLHFEFYSRLLYGGPTLFLIWAWLGGFVLYRNRHDGRFQMALLCLGALAFSVNRSFLTRFAIFTYIFAACVIIYADYIKLRVFVLRILNYLGELSYPLYVFHLPSLIVSYAFFGINDGMTLFLISIASSAVFYHAIDAPLRHRRARRKITNVGINSRVT